MSVLQSWHDHLFYNNSIGPQATTGNPISQALGGLLAQEACLYDT